MSSINPSSEEIEYAIEHLNLDESKLIINRLLDSIVRQYIDAKYTVNDALEHARNNLNHMRKPGAEVAFRLAYTRVLDDIRNTHS